MEPQLAPDIEATEALARSAVYRFLSLAFLPPGDAPGAAAPSLAGEAEGLRRALAALGPAADTPVAAIGERLARGLADAQTAALREEYHRIFGHQIAQDCPLHETQYLGSQVFQQAQQLADIAGFYLAFGLEVADEAGERVDHISLEMEFMQALTFREAYARTHHGPAEVALLRDAQRAFLRDHLSRWVPVQARLVSRKTQGCYREVADLAAAWVAADAAAAGVPYDPAAEYVPLASPDPAGETPPGGAERCPVEPLL